MILSLIKNLFGSSNDRIVKKFESSVQKINDLEPKFAEMSDQDLKNMTHLFRERLIKGETLDDILPEAFATVREASKRVLNMRHFDVQLVGGMVLHYGKISEMRTGEGKTLVATAPVYLNALTGKGVHVVTVNDYLAKRDAAWMGKVYEFLGLTVGCIVHDLDDEERRAAYACDVTHATNNELGFDYLRDNMKFRLDEMVMREFNYAIVDEVDSILVDEARTPLIISGAAEDSSELYQVANSIIPRLLDEDFEKDEKQRSVTLTEKGSTHIEKILEEEGVLKGGSLYDIHNVILVHHINQALKAHKIFRSDVDYIVKNNKVIIIDEFTGRMMEGRRYSDGLHQALEAKEGVQIQTENQTLASITFQNYFRNYPKLAGMTGTAITEAQEFMDIYKLECVEIPTNIKPKRIDHDDVIYRTEKEKFAAIAELVKESHAKQQPVLVGTISIEKSEELSDYLNQSAIPHQILNARYHEQEALIISEAGSPGAVTIATNMAGRGTDIKLGGNAESRFQQQVSDDMDDAAKEALMLSIKNDVKENEELVKKAGGLYVIGTERHESRRIDNQLRGRSGRQGDPGETRFFLSLDDDLMRIFGSERLDTMLKRLGLKPGESITHPWVSKALERAQKRVEARNYDIRKHLLKYDDVMNDQRKVIYDQRKEIMMATSLHDAIVEMREELILQLCARCIPEGTYADHWDIPMLHEETLRLFNLDLPFAAWADQEGMGPVEIADLLKQKVDEYFHSKEEKYGEVFIRRMEKGTLLHFLDQNWKDHLHMLDHLRQGINLRAYAQRDPLNEFKREAFNLFEEMLDRLKENTISVLAHFEANENEMGGSFLGADDVDSIDKDADAMEELHRIFARKSNQIGSDNNRHGQLLNNEDMKRFGEVPRNALCPCGSGLKYKYCHGKI